MSDRGEHLLGKRTGRQLIHYSVNGGIIQAGGVCIQMCVCVCPWATHACVFYGFWSSGNMTKRSINEATYLSCRQKRLLCVY